MQALNNLAGNAFNYDMHNWGPSTAANQQAIKKFEAWLQARQGEEKPDPGGTSGLPAAPLDKTLP